MNSVIHFKQDNGLRVTIDTERLFMRSVTDSEQDSESYSRLFGDPVVMEKFATGQTLSRETIEERIRDVWVKQSRENDPYGPLAVFQTDENQFIGNVALAHGSRPGQAEVGYLFMARSWGKGVGTEAVSAIVLEYAPETIKHGYTLEGKVLDEIMATARYDNFASIKILEKVGMVKDGEEEKYGALRYCFSKKIGV